MALYVVTYAHPNEQGWNKHVLAHVLYLQELLKAGVLLASGPFVGTAVKSAMLVMSAASREELLDVIAKDPFAIEGLTEDMTVTEWNPIFGAFAEKSSRARRQ